MILNRGQFTINDVFPLIELLNSLYMTVKKLTAILYDGLIDPSKLGIYIYALGFFTLMIIRR